MPIKHVEKDEWLELMREDSILLGAFTPSLTQFTVEMECEKCGRPIYIGLHEKEDAMVLCIVCGLDYFSGPDRALLEKALIHG